MSSVFLLKV